MCGISGIFSSSLSPDEMGAAVLRMVQSLRHRGPDGHNVRNLGSCVLGHNRLAVIDTSEAAAQPMTEAGVTIVYNGEMSIFVQERRELEKEGFVFSSTSDTEVLLKLYLRYGVDFLKRLRGMYAFALWDSREKKLICARDPLGIKPFLFSLIPGGVIFSSELKGIIASRLLSCEVDRQALRCLLERGSVTQPASILQGVNWLLPGHVLIMQESRVPEIRQFSSFKAGTIDVAGASREEMLRMGRSYIDTALDRQLIADVPLGAFLSGGIDSSLLVALMAERHSGVRTFSVGFEGGLDTASEDETDDALAVARHLGVEHTKVVVRKEEIARHIRSIATGLDHPTVDGVNSWFVTWAARKEVTVAISGTGGDELFAGYPWFSAMHDWEYASPWSKLRRRLRGETFLSTFDAQYRLFSRQEAGQLCPGSTSPGPRLDPLNAEAALNRVTGLVLQGYTRDQLLADIDTAAMWHGLEVRVPLLDEDLLAFALSLPTEMKLGGGIAGAPVGSYAATGVKRLLVALGEPLLPEKFSHRAKRGFTLPFDGWLRGVLAAEMDDLLSETTVKARGFFEVSAVASVRRSFQARQCSWVYPWLLMMIELWAQEMLDG